MEESQSAITESLELMYFVFKIIFKINSLIILLQRSIGHSVDYTNRFFFYILDIYYVKYYSLYNFSLLDLLKAG